MLVTPSSITTLLTLVLIWCAGQTVIFCLCPYRCACFLRTRRDPPRDILQGVGREVQQRPRRHDYCRRKGSQPFPLFLHNMPPLLSDILHILDIPIITQSGILCQEKRRFFLRFRSFFGSWRGGGVCSVSVFEVTLLQGHSYTIYFRLKNLSHKK